MSDVALLYGGMLAVAYVAWRTGRAAQQLRHSRTKLEDPS